MRMANFLKTMLAICVVAACACFLAACSGSGSTGGAAAATVNGNAISEEEVTETVQNVRAQSGIEEDDAWGEFLVANDMTPESVREQIIDSLVDQELVREGAAELGVTVEDSEIDTYVESMKGNFDDDEAWQDALKQAGFSEDEYRDSIRTSLLQQKLNQHFEDEADVSDEDILESAKTYAPYYDGAKRSSHILFKVDDTSDADAMKAAKEKAQGVLEEINSGSIDFADAAKKYSDDSSADNGGDVGWDVTNSFVTAYTDALDKLDKDQVSDVVESEYGYHIIKVTDVYKAPDEVKKLSDLPKEFQDTVKDMAKSTKANTDYNDWLAKLKEAADIVINDMPADAPYNIDLAKYQEAASGEAADAEGSGEAASDEAADAEEAADASGESAESAEATEASEGSEKQEG